MDNAKCPKCEHYNAMLLNPHLFGVCRDCGYIDTTDSEFMWNLKRHVYWAIEARARTGVGIRTTEADELYRLAILGPKPSNLSWNDGSASAREWFSVRPEPGLMKKALEELASEGSIKFVTEANHPDYCWIVPFKWEDRAVPGFIYVPKVVTAPFDLW